jgi:membrane-associated phospholipid phosphatase
MSKTSTSAELFTERRLTIADRLTRHWRLKLFMLVALTVCFCGPYMFLAHHAFSSVHDLPLTALDRLAGFDPRWVWVYQSVYLLTATLPWLATTRAELKTYLVGFTWLASICFLIYLFCPTRVPRPLSENPSGMYWLLLAYDGPYNAFPSLHAGFLYFTLAFARRVYGRVPLTVTIVLCGWSALILWSTLATKEHYVVDLIAGIALAAGCDAAAWSSRFRSVAVKSQVGLR